MAGFVSVDFDGLDRFSRKIGRFGDDVIRKRKGWNEDAAKIVKRRADRNAPRRTGALASSVAVSATADEGTVTYGNAAVPYAGPIHYGWPNRPYGAWIAGVARGGPIPAQPWLADALTDRERKIVDMYDDEIGRLTRRYDA